METAIQSALAERVIGVLRLHEAELRAAGIIGLSLFGSVARGTGKPASDVDLAVEFSPAARIDLFQRVGLEQRIASLPGGPVDLLAEPIEKERLRATIRSLENRLHHGYDGLVGSIPWNTARHRVPSLAADARSALERLRAG